MGGYGAYWYAFGPAPFGPYIIWGGGTGEDRGL